MLRMDESAARRLTNLQLERTLQDLFAIDVPLARLMSDEQRTDGFINIADGQPMSHFQLQSHLTVVDAALDEAFDRAATTEKPFTKHFTAREIARANPRRRCREPEMLKGKSCDLVGADRSFTAPTARHDLQR